MPDREPANREKTCLVPGSFDPPTLGHRFLVEEAVRRYGRVLVVGFINSEKHYTFTESQRKRLMKEQFGDLPVVFGFSRGMLYAYCRRHGVDVILKGVRNMQDREYELKMAEYNAARCPSAVTVLIDAPPELEEVSSSTARALLTDGGEAERLLGPRVARLCLVYLEKNRNK